MIRQPSTYRQLHAWWNTCVRGEHPPHRHIDDIQCGYYKCRLRSGGIWIPARVYVEREIDPLTGELTCDERLVLEVEGIVETDELRALERFQFCRPITKAEFDRLTDYRLRDSRMMDGMAKVDLSDAPTTPRGVSYAR